MWELLASVNRTAILERRALIVARTKPKAHWKAVQALAAGAERQPALDSAVELETLALARVVVWAAAE